MARVFVSGALPGDGLSRLEAAGHEVVQHDDGIASSTFEDAAGSIDAAVTLISDRIDASFLAKTPKLQVVANVAVGVDNVELDACRKRGVVVTNTPDVLSEATADVALGLLLDAARRISEGDRLIRAGKWTGWTPTFLMGRRVHGMSLGIVGLGRIGRAVARRARGFGMHVGYTQRKRANESIERALGATWVASIDELCTWADAITIHTPLTEETRHMFSRERLARMRPGSMLVNTSRGPIVDEAALAEALRDGPLAAAGLDVFENEPKVHPALLELPNVVMTPHIGSADPVTRAAMASLAVDNVLAVLAGEPAKTPVS